MERKNLVICEFLKHIDEFHAEQWEDSVNLLKTLLEHTISASSVYSEYRNYTTFLQDYLDRGKTINQSSSVLKKMEYFRGFNEHERKPVLDLTSEKAKELERPFDSFRSSMLNVLSKFYTKYIKAGQDMLQTLAAQNVTFSDELFMLLYQYPPEYKGSGIESLGSRILALRDRYPCF